jgi:hypothetical protein
VDATERIRQLLDPSFVAGLDGRPLDELRAMKAECTAVEHAVSYYRRLAQARVEILDAERSRRARGGELSELVADLPRILGAEPGRSSVADARVADPDTPGIELHWDDAREELVGDSTLVNLPALGDAALDDATARLGDFERELSDVRHALHGVIDVIEREIATRQVAGTAG